MNFLVDRMASFELSAPNFEDHVEQVFGTSQHKVYAVDWFQVSSYYFSPFIQILSDFLTYLDFVLLYVFL